jgi:hypothetical protein
MQIKLSQGKFALIDDQDFDLVNQFKWHLSSHGYAITELGRGIFIYMYKLINKTPNGFETDHINRNKLDNRKENLRSVNKVINARNRGENKNNTSGYKGVSWDRNIKKWAVYLWKNYKKINLGYFDDLQKACEARKIGEKIHWV